MIEINHVTYTYPNASRPALDDLSLRIGEGEFLLVCGSSGAGKSTFLRLLNGLVPHFYGGRIGGHVRVWGRATDTHQPRDLADLVGFVFQDPEAQLVVDVVEDEIVFAMENLGLHPRVMRRRVEEVLDQLGIAHLRRRQISSLSGGERQRVAIAAVLAAQPRALVLDEPTSQLDPHAAEEVLTVLQKLNADLGLTVVLSEHRLERVVQYADRVLYLPARDQGRRTNDEGSGASDRESSPTFVLGHSSFVVGNPRDVLARIDLAPPLVALGKALGWSPLPLTIKEGRRFAQAGEGRRTKDEGRRTQDAGRGTQDAGRRTNDERRTTNDERRTTNDERRTGNGLESDRQDTRAPSNRYLRSSPAVGEQPALVVSHMHFSYGEHEAIYDLSLAARPGEVLALMGRNGSGKTTLLKLIVGLLKPQRGALTVFGRDMTRTPVEELAALVGYVPQDPRALLFHDTLREELAFTLDQRPLTLNTQSKIQTPRGHPKSKIDATLERFGLAHLAETYPRILSGGQAQRAALAAILVGDPPIALLDEPTRGLDYAAKAELGRLLRGLAAEQRTILLATHDVELVAAYADRVALLGDGELVVEGPVREVLGDSLIFSSQVAKLFPGTGWLTVDDVVQREM